jgi:hypothetical protein
MHVRRNYIVSLVAVLNVIAGTVALVLALAYCSAETDPLVKQFCASVPLYFHVAVAVAATSGMVAFGLLASALLLLRMNPLGRTIAIATAIASMILWVGFALWTRGIVVPAFDEFWDVQINRGGYAGSPEQRYEAALGIATIGHVDHYVVVISFWILFAWPLLSLILLTRWRVREALAAHRSSELRQAAGDANRADRGEPKDKPPDGVSIRENRFQ